MGVAVKMIYIYTSLGIIVIIQVLEFILTLKSHFEEKKEDRLSINVTFSEGIPTLNIDMNGVTLPKDSKQKDSGIDYSKDEILYGNVLPSIQNKDSLGKKS